MSHYEVEIKSLLGSKENAENLKQALQKADQNTKLLSKHSQLNHYFEGGDVQKLKGLLDSHVSKEDGEKLAGIVSRGSNFSVRTRDADGKVLIVLKASVDAGSSHNTVTRLEFEAPVKMSLEELDKLVLSAGFEYQAKWSREREEYSSSGFTICLDRNAGYGYLAEFEKVVEKEDELEDARRSIEAFMQSLGVEELAQARLERMFAHYNANWRDYYGTDKVFVIE